MLRVVHGDILVSNPQATITNLADLVCLLCGTRIGTLETGRADVPTLAVFQEAESGSRTLVADWRRMRCRRCGGSPILEDVRQITKFPQVHDEPHVRRGRPPKWLVEQRRREREMLDSDAA